jgi:hypothetical protein
MATFLDAGSAIVLSGEKLTQNDVCVGRLDHNQFQVARTLVIILI